MRSVEVVEVHPLLQAHVEPQAADLLEDAAENLLAHLHFLRDTDAGLHSTNPVERPHKEIKRRTNAVGIFPNGASLVRMVGTLLAEQDDQWQVADRRYFSVGSMARTRSRAYVASTCMNELGRFRPFRPVRAGGTPSTCGNPPLRRSEEGVLGASLGPALPESWTCPT